MLLQQIHILIAAILYSSVGDPLENAIAERVNGILKTELISSSYQDIDKAALSIARAVIIYNFKRRHSSLNWQIPADVHNQKGPQIKRWKNYYQPLKKRRQSCKIPNRQGSKNISYSCRGYENIFCQRTAKNIFNQPYSG